MVPWRWVPLLLAFGWLAVAAGAVDIRVRRLPDALTLPALPVALLLLLPVGGSAVWRGVLGAVVAAAAHLVVHLAVPAALGAGDVKLSAPLGAALGAASWEALVVAGLLAALFSGALAAAVLVARGRRGACRTARRCSSPGCSSPPPVHGAREPCAAALRWVSAVDPDGTAVTRRLGGRGMMGGCCAGSLPGSPTVPRWSPCSRAWSPVWRSPRRS